MIGQDAGKNFAYILGVYLGDGCISIRRVEGEKERPQFRLNTIDEDFSNATKAALQTMTAYKVTQFCYPVSKSSKPNWAICLNDTPLCDRLVSDTASKKKIPEYVFGWPKDLKLQFIAGLMDSEGFVAANNNASGRRYYMGYKSCDIWVPDFIKILQSVGILIGKIGIEKPRFSGYKTPTRFTIKMQSWIDSGARFNIVRKQKRVDEWAETVPDPRGLRFRAKLTPETTCTAPDKG